MVVCYWDISQSQTTTQLAGNKHHYIKSQQQIWNIVAPHNWSLIIDWNLRLHPKGFVKPWSCNPYQNSICPSENPPHLVAVPASDDIEPAIVTHDCRLDPGHQQVRHPAPLSGPEQGGILLVVARVYIWESSHLVSSTSTVECAVQLSSLPPHT